MSPPLPAGYRVEYLDETERERYRIVPVRGRLYTTEGIPFDTGAATSRWANADARAIFVMDEHGNLYASNTYRVGRFHHSSFLAGAPVAAAGEVTVLQGRLTFLSNRSGHYQPSPDTLKVVLRVLGESGIDVDSVEVESWGPATANAAGRTGRSGVARR